MALQRIYLRNFVTVSELELDFSGGFTVLTGETGAGKSILIDALQIALGAKADSSYISTGAPGLEVVAELTATPPVTAFLEAHGFQSMPTALLRRTVEASGRSRGWINGSPATNTQMRALGDLVVEIHGQHAWQKFLRPNAAREMLDDYAECATKEITKLWDEWQTALRRLNQARTMAESAAVEHERLRWEFDELNRLAPATNEWEDLSVQQRRAAHAKELTEGAHQALQLIEADTGGAVAALTRTQSCLERLSAYEPSFTAVLEVLASACANATDAAHSLHQYVRHNEFDPDELQRLDERMSQWLQLARRHKCQPEALPELLENMKQRLANIDELSDIAALAEYEARANARYCETAAQLSSLRLKAAPRLSNEITHLIQELGMPGGQFVAAVLPDQKPGASGTDSVEFLIAGHPGAVPQPIQKVASGGELSRIALALTVQCSQRSDAQTCIFDEVDTGIGGGTAEIVGRLMARLGRNRQVFCVTHLAQVAAFGSQHLMVSKVLTDDSAASEVRTLGGDDRVKEIARMIGGARLTPISLAHAEALLHAEPAAAVSTES